MQRQSRLVGTGKEAEYSQSRQIHQIINNLFHQTDNKQCDYIASIIKKPNGSELLTQTIADLRRIQQIKRNQNADSHTLGGLAGVLEFCELPDEDPAEFIKSIKENETVSGRIMSIINSDARLKYEFDYCSAEDKARLLERTKFIDDQNADIKMIEALIERINAVKAIHLNQKKPKPGKTFHLFGAFGRPKKDKDDHHHNTSRDLLTRK